MMQFTLGVLATLLVAGLSYTARRLLRAIEMDRSREAALRDRYR
jgi:hypothetical protein